MSKHTLGPWRITKAQLDSGYVCRMVEEIRSEGGLVANVLTEEEEGRANARLIAAAPDLLAALEDLLAYGQRPEVMAEVHKAIAKAKAQGLA